MNEEYSPTKWEIFIDKYWYDTKVFGWYVNFIYNFFYKKGGKSVCFLFGHQYRNGVDHEKDYEKGTITYITKVYCIRCTRIFGCFGCHGHAVEYSLTGNDASKIHIRRVLDETPCKECTHPKGRHNLSVLDESYNNFWPNGKVISTEACSLIVDPSKKHELSRGNETLCPCRKFIGEKG